VPSPRSRQTGQASVELVALLPVLALCAAVAWQLCLVGHAAWAGSVAARAAARAEAVGADAHVAATTRLPDRLRPGLRVRAADDGAVTVVVRVPSVLPGGGPLTTLTSRARFAAQR
jgi:hypothetical protein